MGLSEGQHNFTFITALVLEINLNDLELHKDEEGMRKIEGVWYQFSPLRSLRCSARLIRASLPH